MKSRILIVEDERILRKAISISLRREGYEVEEATSRAEALNVNLSEIGLLILDIGLPDCNGLDLLAEIRGDRPGIGAIVMTALDTQGVESRAIASGASAFLTKPVPLQLLKTAVRDIEGKRAIVNEPDKNFKNNGALQ